MALSPKAKEIKAEMNKWDLIKLKSFCTAKELIDKTKRQPTEWKKVFANDMTDKGLIFKRYKRFIPLNIKRMEKDNVVYTHATHIHDGILFSHKKNKILLLGW